VGGGAASLMAATLGLVAIACGDDDDASPNMPSGGGGATDEGGKSSTAGKTANGGKAGASTTGGKGGTAATGGKAGSTSAGAGGAEAGMAGAGGAPDLDADLEPLNALLSAEYNAITAYTAGAGLINAAPNTDPLYGLREVVVAIAVDIQSQHKLHAAALVDAITELDGIPVEEADVAAAFAPPQGLVDNPTISNVLKFAASAERGAAVAYNQVLASMENAQLRFLASAIEGDETQHFIVLTALVLGLADPGPNLTVATADDVVPQPFVSKVGSVNGLNAAPADYFP
jgi:hypothetical protein